MTEILLILRAVSMVMWLWIAWRFFRYARRAFTINARPTDPVIASLFGLSLSFVMLQTRAYLFSRPPMSELEQAWLSVAYLLCIAAQIVAVRWEAWGRDNG